MRGHSKERVGENGQKYKIPLVSPEYVMYPMVTIVNNNTILYISKLQREQILSVLTIHTHTHTHTHTKLND